MAKWRISYKMEVTGVATFEHPADDFEGALEAFERSDDYARLFEDATDAELEAFDGHVIDEPEAAE